MIKIKKKYLDTELEVVVEGRDLKEALLKATVFTIKDYCALCDSEEIALDGNKTGEGHTYIKRKCLNPECKATSTLGTYKDGSGYFWNKWEIWNPNSSSGANTSSLTHGNRKDDYRSTPPPKTRKNVNYDYKDDLPF